MIDDSMMIHDFSDPIIQLPNITNGTPIGIKEFSYVEDGPNVSGYAFAFIMYVSTIILINEFIYWHSRGRQIFPSPFVFAYNQCINWYKEKKMTLPFVLSEKAKSSPLISPMLNLVLPNYSSLDKAEKGRNIRNRSFTVSRLNNFKAGEPVSITAETKLTIFTMVGSAISPRTEETVDFKQTV